jgi:hypothetical protein
VCSPVQHAPFDNGTIPALLFTIVTPSKRHQVGGPEIVQFVGLLILICLIYRQFGSGMHYRMTLSALTVFAAGLFLFIWPMALKAR